MRVFVTGGTGFVGGAVVRALIAAGHEVQALARPRSDLRQLEGLPVERIVGDPEDVENLRRRMNGCDWLFPGAALYAFWGYRWEDFYRTNVKGTRRVLDVASQVGVRRIFYTSSIATLGIPRGIRRPMRTPRSPWRTRSATTNAPSFWPRRWPATWPDRACRWSSSTPLHRSAWVTTSRRPPDR